MKKLSVFIYFYNENLLNCLLYIYLYIFLGLYNIGYNCYFGENGEKKDYAKAVLYYEKAADLGDGDGKNYFIYRSFHEYLN